MVVHDLWGKEQLAREADAVVVGEVDGEEVGQRRVEWRPRPRVLVQSN